MIWTDTAIEHLKTRAAEGVSYGAIAKELGATRNGTIGKAHRLKLPSRKRQSSIPATPKPKRHRKNGLDGGIASRISAPRDRQHMIPAKPVTPLPVAFPEPPSRHLTLMELTDRTCKYPEGAPHERAHFFCGNPSKDGSSFCPAHHARVWMPPRERAR